MDLLSGGQTIEGFLMHLEESGPPREVVFGNIVHCDLNAQSHEQ